MKRHIFLASCALLSSCGSAKNDQKGLDFSNLKIPEGVQKKVEEQFQTIQKQFNQMWEQMKQKSHGQNINFRGPDSFHAVHSNAGFFYVTIQTLEKHQDGYRLKLRVGNPLAADFSDLSIKLSWGGLPTGKNHKGEGRKEKIIQLNGLQSSSWKEVEALLSPVDSEDEMENVAVEIRAGGVNLLK